MTKCRILVLISIFLIGAVLGYLSYIIFKPKTAITAIIETPQTGSSPFKPDYARQLELMVAEKKSTKELIQYLETNAGEMQQKDVDKAVMDIVDVLQNNYKADRDVFFKKQVQMMRSSQKSSDSQRATPREALDKPYIEQGYLIHASDAHYHIDIDYGNLLNKFEKYITAQVGGYLSIMDQDTRNLYSEEGRLQITFNQFAQRLIREETYIKNFPDAPATQDIRNVYNRSTVDFLGGRGIDDIIDYHTKMIKHDALESYKFIAKTYPNSSLANILTEYPKVLEKNRFKLNADVKKYIKNATGIDPDRPVDHEI